MRGIALPAPAVLLCAAATVSGAVPRESRFDGAISREVLEGYLSRSITMMDLCTGRKDPADDLRMLRRIGARFAGRTLYLWGGEAALSAKLAAARAVAAQAHEADPDLILQAGIFEIVTTQVGQIPVPDWVFTEFGLAPEERTFRYEAMLFEGGQFRDHWGRGASVPDVTRLETRLWFFFLARQYIDAGMEAIHFGQVALIGAADKDLAGWSDVLRRVRACAAGHARRGLVLCDAHTPDGGPRVGDRLLFDFHSFPLRIKEVPGKPQEGMLEMGYLDSLFGRSKGGVTPSGWACESLPYLVELDNWGSSGKGGQGGLPYWPWGYDEICWFAHQPEGYRNAWLRYAAAWVRRHDPNGFLQMPGSRCLADPVNGLSWYEANRRSPACPNGFGQEDTIRSIWAEGEGPVPRTPCAVSGYWVYARSAPGEWSATLDAIRSLGGEVLVQFGPRVTPVPPEQHAGHAVLAACRVDGLPVVEATRRELAALHPGNALGRVYVMAAPESYGPRLVARPGLDRVVDDGDRRYWRLLLPADSPGAVPEASPAAGPRTYDMVVVAGRTPYDSLAELLAGAEARGQHVFAGMPIPPPHPQYPWDPWLETLPVVTEVCRRVLADYRERFGANPAFEGVYDSLETPVQDPPLKAVLAAYRALHAVVRAELPARRILVSPYWDARLRAPTGVAPESVREGIQAIARCEVDIIAPQDSRGTGKVGLFWPCQAGLPVDPRLAPVVGRQTYGEAYSASTRRFYEAAAEGLNRLGRDEGTRVELWANLEAFEPGAGVPCGVHTDSQRTTRERLDQAVMFAGPWPARLISYMWDGYYVCRGGLEATLSEEIAADWARPIVVDAVPEPHAGRAGLTVLGWGIAGGTVELRWKAGERTQSRSAQPEGPLSGTVPAACPRLERLWVPAELPSGTAVEVAVTRAGLRCHHPFLLEVRP